MSDGKETGKDALSGEDLALWKAMTGDVARLDGKDYVPPPPEKPAKAGKTPAPAREDTAPQGRMTLRETVTETLRPGQKALRPATGQDVDRRTGERLRKGRMEIEARLDLHGMKQDEAHAALEGFIARACEQGKRCVLVITGKGKTGAPAQEWFEPEPGVLKRRTPEWLGTEKMRQYVLKFAPAQRKDGGDGAFYVLLRRKRGGKER